MSLFSIHRVLLLIRCFAVVSCWRFMHLWHNDHIENILCKFNKFRSHFWVSCTTSMLCSGMILTTFNSTKRFIKRTFHLLDCPLFLLKVSHDSSRLFINFDFNSLFIFYQSQHSNQKYLLLTFYSKKESDWNICFNSWIIVISSIIFITLKLSVIVIN